MASDKVGTMTAEPCKWCVRNTTVSPVAKLRPVAFYVAGKRATPDYHAACGIHLATAVRYVTVPGGTALVRQAKTEGLTR
jgi:hypothetical protein